jgi:TadE-like protein
MAAQSTATNEPACAARVGGPRFTIAVKERRIHGPSPGQELVEFGIVVVLFMTLVLGVLMFGQAWMVLNAVTHAARDGARIAASWADRGACQQINSVDQIRQAVNDRIAAVTAQTFTVTVTQDPPNTAPSPPCDNPGSIPTVQVNVNGCIPYLFNVLGFGSADCPGGFTVNRTVTFPDELRG